MGVRSGRRVGDVPGPMVQEGPRAVNDPRQLIQKTHDNLIPDEFGVVSKNVFPQQVLAPTSGGQYSGRAAHW